MKSIYYCVRCGKEINGGFYNAPAGPHCPDCWEQREKEQRAAAYLLFKGTPGPWYVASNNVDSVIKGFFRGGVVAIAPGSDSQKCTANARLIAAAPDLLGAAKLALKEWGTLSQRPETYEALEAAIRKALGNE